MKKLFKAHKLHGGSEGVPLSNQEKKNQNCLVSTEKLLHQVHELHVLIAFEAEKKKKCRDNVNRSIFINWYSMSLISCSSLNWNHLKLRSKLLEVFTDCEDALFRNLARVAKQISPFVLVS